MAETQGVEMSIAAHPSSATDAPDAVPLLAIRTDKLEKKYGKTEAVRGIDLNIERGRKHPLHRGLAARTTEGY